MQNYTPAPVDTSDIRLPETLYQLTEDIARHVHDTWAQGRIADGWRYGEKKDSDAKTTPLLVPYEDLSDEEKEYDRKTAFETLKLIVKLGYTVEKKEA
ncbi:MAG: Ryanodine receptor Ryr [Lachnospiraceae bacterium]|nr:Ryanodine receptor Ryr [Lachnospiraceae bacterium]